MTNTNTTTKQPRYFYAAYHRYSTTFSNDVVYILRFESKKARDAYVDGEIFDDNYRREAVTRDEARRIFPDAFRLDDYRDEYGVMDMRDWRSDEPGVEFFAPECC